MCTKLPCRTYSTAANCQLLEYLAARIIKSGKYLTLIGMFLINIRSKTQNACAQKMPHIPRCPGYRVPEILAPIKPIYT